MSHIYGLMTISGILINSLIWCKYPKKKVQEVKYKEFNQGKNLKAAIGFELVIDDIS